MSVSLASHRSVAGKIVSAVNGGECYACHRPYPAGGVLTFGMSGSATRWYPDAASADHATLGVRYVWPDDGRRHITRDEVEAWLAEQDDAIQHRVEELEERRAERRARREMNEDDHGFRVDAYPCADCGYLKHRPADECERCGDNPVPLGMDYHDYNRGYGYRD